MPSRQIIDAGGVTWEVFEVHRLSSRPRSVRPALENGWLAFVSVTAKRRLPDYPDDWMQRSDADLLAMRDRAFPSLASRNLAAQESVAAEVARAGAPVTSATAATGLVNAALGDPRPRPDDTLPSTTPARTVLGAAGSAEHVVRLQAREARREGRSVIDGMVRTKRALAAEGHGTSRDEIKRARQWFIETFYFEQEREDERPPPPR
ncbi:MAG: hypothetical protein JWL60_2653 [Gemmatimonadetes bacterium]|jgi:hypothetical protein|nr:hypothetical protein [Gemmatimonadota bacterium]